MGRHQIHLSLAELKCPLFEIINTKLLFHFRKHVSGLAGESGITSFQSDLISPVFPL